jgi:quercetin dioxygenase-like cupin family protein
MQEKYNESTPLRPEGERMLDAPMLSTQLPFYMEQIKKEPTWKDSDRNAITLFKSDKLRVVLMALKAGAEMTKHTAKGIIQVQVLEGQILFRTDEQSAEINKGELLILHENIPHSVSAKMETIFLLSVIVG